MDNVIEELSQAAEECEQIAFDFLEGETHQLRTKIEEAANEVGRAWSGSWLGYQAYVYTDGLVPKKPGDHFDSTSGASAFNETSGAWAEYDPKSVEAVLLEQAEVSLEEYNELLAKGAAADRDFSRLRDEALTTIDAILSNTEDQVLTEKRENVAQQLKCITPEEYANHFRPSEAMTRDHKALSGGFVVPPHISVLAKTVAAVSRGAGFRALAENLRYVEQYLRKRQKMVTGSKTGNRIFIGHGRSSAWRDLKEFVQDRLDLEFEEFDRESTPGKSTKERLQEMLDNAGFAFLVLTAEDDMGDGSKQARANVIHEVGLFQGRLGFEKAIILLEKGCAEFSNIVGTTQIRFTKGNIKAVSEELRRVLEREGLIKK